MHTTQTTTQAIDGAQGNDNVPLEIMDIGVDSDNAALICLGWLTTTINHCLRMSLCQLTKHQMPHNSSRIGSTPATATAALKEEGGTRHALVSTQR